MILGIAKFIRFMNGNIFLNALLIAVVLPFVIIAVGYAIHMLGVGLAVLLSLFVDPWWVNVIINYIMFPGVMLHELSHALFAVITGAKVTEMKLFKKEGDSLGHVNFRHRGSTILIAIQKIFISAAPMFCGFFIVTGCWHVVAHTGVNIELKILLGYIGFSMFFHMTMSPQDIKVYWKGIPVFMGILFLEGIILRLFHVI